MLLMFCGCLALPTRAFADEASVAPEPGAAAKHEGPWVGGHVGFALPLMVFGKDSTFIGDSLGQLGLAPGITVHLNERWAIDFETVAYADFMNDTSFFVVDPGVIYKFDMLSLGLRMAVNTHALDNWGFIPIINKGWSVGLIKLFVELDLPTFITHREVTMAVQPQLGVAF